MTQDQDQDHKSQDSRPRPRPKNSVLRPRPRLNITVCLSVQNGCALWSVVQFTTDLSLWWDSPMFRALWHQCMSTCFQPSFSSSTWKRGAVWMCKLGVISQERLKIVMQVGVVYAASIGPTTDDLDWPWVAISCLVHYICSSWASCKCYLSIYHNCEVTFHICISKCLIIHWSISCLQCLDGTLSPECQESQFVSEIPGSCIQFLEDSWRTLT